MKMQIVSCPHCGTYLLNDTTECHACGHILDQRAASLPQSKILPTDHAVSEDMEACPSCAETCRKGLVRCWNCGTFLRPEIEASYRKKQASTRYEVEHIDLPILEATFVTEEDSLQRRDSTLNSMVASYPYQTVDSSGDDDFDLSMGTVFGEIVDEAQEVASQSDESETFRLLPIEDDSPPAALTKLESISPIKPVQSVEPVQPDVIEPPVQSEAELPPVQALNEPPPSKQEVEAAATEDLLKIAADEEQDIKQVRKSMRSKDTFVIFCPQGCRIRVKERHRGRKGKCPRCQSEFVVPKKAAAKKPEAAVSTSDNPVVTSRYKKWLNDIRLHTVDPVKLRIKADSLLNECQAVDIGFSADDLLIATLVVGKFGANAKKFLPIRQAMIEHFSKQGTFEQLAVAAKKKFSKESLSQFTPAQPAAVGVESLFADIPVFGANRIAIKIPKSADTVHPQYLSFCLSEFRAFVEAMQTVCGVDRFGTNTEVPLTDEYIKHKCTLSNAPVLELAKLSYYVKDPGFKLEVTGWRCAKCGIILSEAARTEAKLGGANGKGIAKAKCPKCTQKFGDIPLYQLASSESTTPATPDPEPALA